MEKKDNEFLKKCYIVCRNAGWDKYLISLEAIKLNMSYEELIDYAREYIDNGFMNWDFEEENDSVEVKKIATTSSTANLKRRYGNVIPNFKGTMDEVEKYCYNESLNVGFKEDKMKEITEKLGLGYEIFLKKVRNYARKKGLIVEFEERLNASRDELRRRDYLKKYPDLVQLIESLLKENDEEKIIEICKNSRINIDANILKRLDYCVSLLYPNDVSLKLDEVRDKFKIYRSHTNSINRKKQIESMKKTRSMLLESVLPYATKYISMYIDGDYETVRSFINLNNLSLETFNILVETLSYHDQGLYNKYLQKINNDNTKRYASIVEMVKEMTQEMKNGIDGRSFDIIDYYRYIKIPFDDVLKIINGKLNAEETRLFKRFVTKYNNLKELNENNINYILSEIVEVECERDKNDNIIKGTGRIITRDEKVKIMDYIKSLNIPLNLASYRSAFDRYVKGYLDLNEKGRAGK